MVCEEGIILVEMNIKKVMHDNVAHQSHCRMVREGGQGS